MSDGFSLLDDVCFELASSERGLSAMDLRQKLQKKKIDTKNLKDTVAYAEKCGMIERKDIKDSDGQSASHLFLKGEYRERYKQLMRYR